VEEKFLIIGVNGLIGSAVAAEFARNFRWQGTYYSRTVDGCLRCDITDYKNAEEIFSLVRPTCVIHAANLEGGFNICENNPGLARKFHFEGTVNIGRLCQQYNCKFIFLSSECVFDGKKEHYKEEDITSPLSKYGRYKVESEAWIQAFLKDYVIVRTMTVFGWDPLTETPNAVMKVYFSVSRGQKCHVPVLRWGTPTYVGDLAKSIAELALSAETGIFHVAGLSFVNRYAWLKETCQFLGWDSSLVIPQDGIIEDAALRPFRIGLDTEKFRSKFNTRLHNVNESMELLKEDMLRRNQFSLDR